MRTFERLTAIAAPLPIANIDTDKILAARFLKTITRDGLGSKLFYTMRFDDDGSEQDDFILNMPPWREAGILVALDNFGCGSSREHAPWALADFGIRAIIAPSFADIFFNNCFKNGILPIVLPTDAVQELLALSADPATARFTIDLPAQSIHAHDREIAFAIAPERKEALLHGLDEIGASLKRVDDIARWEAGSTVVAPIITADARLAG